YVSTVAAPLDQDVLLAIPRAHRDLCVIPSAYTLLDREQHACAAWQDVRQAMADFSLGLVDRRERLRRAAARRNSPETSGPVRKYDRLVGSPARAEDRRGRAERDGRPPGERDLFERSGCALRQASGPEPEPSSVGREKRAIAVFGAGNRRCLETIQRAN